MSVYLRYLELVRRKKPIKNPSPKEKDIRNTHKSYSDVLNLL
jgi:hypothetical protein